MATINGKLINQENQQLHDLQNKIELITEVTAKLNLFVNEYSKDLELNRLLLKSVEQQVKNLEINSLKEINLKLEKIDRKGNHKFLIIIMSSLIAVLSLSSFFLLRHHNNYCQAQSQEFITHKLD